MRCEPFFGSCTEPALLPIVENNQRPEKMAVIMAALAVLTLQAGNACGVEQTLPPDIVLVEQVFEQGLKFVVEPMFDGNGKTLLGTVHTGPRYQRGCCLLKDRLGEVPPELQLVGHAKGQGNHILV